LLRGVVVCGIDSGRGWSESDSVLACLQGAVYDRERCEREGGEGGRGMVCKIVWKGGQRGMSRWMVREMCGVLEQRRCRRRKPDDDDLVCVRYLSTAVT
jgi:hypothetical protein